MRRQQPRAVATTAGKCRRRRSDSSSSGSRELTSQRRGGHREQNLKRQRQKKDVPLLARRVLLPSNSRNLINVASKNHDKEGTKHTWEGGRGRGDKSCCQEESHRDEEINLVSALAIQVEEEVERRKRLEVEIQEERSRNVLLREKEAQVKRVIQSLRCRCDVLLEERTTAVKSMMHLQVRLCQANNLHQGEERGSTKQTSTVESLNKLTLLDVVGPLEREVERAVRGLTSNPIGQPSIHDRGAVTDTTSSSSDTTSNRVIVHPNTDELTPPDNKIRSITSQNRAAQGQNISAGGKLNDGILIHAGLVVGLPSSPKMAESSLPTLTLALTPRSQAPPPRTANLVTADVHEHSQRQEEQDEAQNKSSESHGEPVNGNFSSLNNNHLQLHEVGGSQFPLHLALEVDEGEEHHLVVPSPTTSPRDAALAFCQRHGIALSAVSPIANFVEEELSKIQKQDPATASSSLAVEDEEEIVVDGGSHVERGEIALPQALEVVVEEVEGFGENKMEEENEVK